MGIEDAGELLHEVVDANELQLARADDLDADVVSGFQSRFAESVHRQGLRRSGGRTEYYANRELLIVGSPLTLI